MIINQYYFRKKCLFESTKPQLKLKLFLNILKTIINFLP